MGRRREGDGDEMEKERARERMKEKVMEVRRGSDGGWGEGGRRRRWARR